MNIKSILGIFCVCIFALVMASPVNAAPVTTSFSGTIDWISIPNSGTDTYGIGTSTMSVGNTYSFSMTHDSDPSMGTITPDVSGMDYDFSGPPYGGSLSINGNNFSSSLSALNVVNGIMFQPPPNSPVDQPLIDAGIPADLSSYVTDVLWMGINSDDFIWNSNGPFEGLEISVVFVDLSGSIFNSTSIPDVIPSLETIDFAFFDIEQWENGAIVFKAGGMLANNIVPIPASLWLFGSGLIGLIGVARRKKV